MSRSQASRARRGFALIVAITLLGLVGATLAVMATTFAGEVRRTQNMAAETQLRQMLIAGEAVAQTRAGSVITQPIAVHLPAQLGNAKLTISGQAAKMRIEAEYEGRHASQVIAFVKDGGKWKTAETQLD